MKEESDKTRNEKQVAEAILDIFFKMPNLQKHDIFIRTIQVFVQNSDFEDSTKNFLNELANGAIKAVDNHNREIMKMYENRKGVKISHLVRKHVNN